MTRKRFISSLVFFVMLGLMIIAPIFLSSDARYFSFIYAIIIPILLLTAKIPSLHLRRMWCFWLLISSHLIALLVYIGDVPSAINLITLILSYLSIFYLVSKSVEVYGDLVFERMVFKYVGWILIIMFSLSPVLTLLHWPANAPEYFPWEALYTDKRLLLIIGQNVGHSNSMWLMAFTAAYIMSYNFRVRHRHWKVGIIFLVLFLLWMLIETKSRLALVFISIIVMAWLSYRKLLPSSLYAVIILITPLLYFGSIVIPSIKYETISLVENIQSNLPSIRLAASSDLQGTASVYSGRYVLNTMLIGAAKEGPWFGVGHSDDRLIFGANKDGFAAAGEDVAVAKSESGLRMLAKYGVIYYSILLLFVIMPIVRAVRGYYIDNIFVITICGIILLSGIGASTFENLYGISGLYAIILLLFHIVNKCRYLLLFDNK